MYKLRSIFEVDFVNNAFLYELRSILEYTSFQKKLRIINEVLLKYKQSIFLGFFVFILRLYFFLGSSLKAYFYWISRIWSINKVYLKYTSYIDFPVREWKRSVCSITLPYSIYSLFLPFFVLEIFKFKDTRFFL